MPKDTLPESSPRPESGPRPETGAQPGGPQPLNGEGPLNCAQRSGEKPSGAQPNGEKPSGVQPSNAEKPAAVQANGAHAHTEKPSTAQSNAEKQSAASSSADKPASATLNVEKPSGEKPSNGEKLSAVQANGEKLSSLQSASGEKASGMQPSNGEKPAAAHPNGEKPSGSQANAEKPAVTQTNGAHPNGGAPSNAEKPNIAQSNGEKPSAVQANGAHANAEKPSGAKSSASEKPAAAQANGAQPGSEQPLWAHPGSGNGNAGGDLRARPGRRRYQREEKRPVRPQLLAAAIAVAAFAALFLMMASAISPERYDLKVGEVSPRTITASKDVTDTITTQMLVDAAVREVQPSYQSDESVMPAVLVKLEDSFAQLRALAQLRVGLDGSIQPLTDETLRKDAQAMRPVVMSDVSLTAALNADDDTLSELSDATVNFAREALVARVAEGQEKETAAKIQRDLVSDGYDEALAEAAGAIVTTNLKANMLLDQETTEQKRQAARESVEDVVYKKGQNIVRAGEVVTRPEFEMLNSLGMLKNRAFDISLYLGLALLILLLALILMLYLYSFLPDMLRDPKRITLLAVILTTTLAWCWAFRSVNAYLMPVALGAMLTARLLKPRLAIVVNIVLSILTGLMAAVDNGTFTATMFGVMLTQLVAGTAVVPVIRNRNSFAGVMLSGAILVLLNTLATVAVGLVNSADIQNVMTWAVWSGGSGLVSAVLTILEAMLFEWAFNLVTASKLLDLSNPNQPLLRRLLLETPGTYHHSILVANLAEAAASAVGANALLARVGAYYHDIGKLKRPMYFKENQMNDNPHDRLDPRVSTAILTAHPHDGVEMAIKAHLPEEIQEIILQHHGDSPVLYFYDKAVKLGGDVDVAEFRYDGPRPRSREAAIVMMADTVEAAARAAGEAAPEKLQQVIRKMIHLKMEDGQFDESLLTFSELSKISDAFLTVLTGVYHDRIEYPEVQIPNRPVMPRRPWPDAGREPNDEPKRADA